MCIFLDIRILTKVIPLNGPDPSLHLNTRKMVRGRGESKGKGGGRVGGGGSGGG